jgi:ribosomal protein S21
LKKKIDREGTLKVVRSHRHYEKAKRAPSPKGESRALFRHAHGALRGYVM